MECASIHGARAMFQRAGDDLRQVVELSPQLDGLQQASLYTDIASFFVPADRQAIGGDFLRRAVEVLESIQDWKDIEFARTAVQVGGALQAFDRNSEAVRLLMPVFAAGESRVQVAPRHDDLWSEYQRAAGAVIAITKTRRLQKDARSLERSRSKWPARPVSEMYLRDTDDSPRVQRKVDPGYTLGAKRAKIQGDVVLGVEVWPDGRLHNIRVLRPLPYGMSWAAIGAARKWRFQPGKRDGEAIKIDAQVEVNFRLKNR